MASDAEKELREAVISHVHAELPDYRVIHELPAGGCRADLAAISEQRVILIELKSSRDVTKRAEQQMKTFTRLAHKAILVADIKFFDRKPYNDGRARCAAPPELTFARSDLWIYPRPPDSDVGAGGYYPWRLNNFHEIEPQAQHFLHLMFREEMVEEATAHGVEFKKNLRMWDIARLMTLSMTGQQIKSAVCRQLRRRKVLYGDDPR